MKRIKTALAAGVLVVSAAAVGVIASSSANAEMSGWERIEQNDTVPGGTGLYEVTALCTSGKKVTGGGYDVAGAKFLTLDTRIATNKATGSGSGWTVAFTKADGAGDKSLDVTVVAVCATP